VQSDRVEKDFPDRPGRIHLAVGNQVFHNGEPVQLLYRIAQSSTHETWRVRPLFVEAPDREDRFTTSDRISFLHTMKAPRWARAA
jgi:hypothetical protein